MSSRRNYSRESRSFYSRSSSCDNNNRFQSSTYRRRPLSSLLIDRDFPSPISTSFAMDRFDDPFLFDRSPRRFFDDFDRRLRWSRWMNDTDDDDFFRQDRSFDFGRNISMNNQSSGITRNIPVQYSPSSWNQRERVYTKIDQGNSSLNNQGNFQTRENRFSNGDWPARQESPTRKRTTMTIFVRQPHVQYSDVPNYQRQTSSSGYSSTFRSNY